MRLQKYLAEAGIASRRKAEELIKAGKVKINGEIITAPGTIVNEGDKVEFKDKEVQQDQDRIYIAFNKPTGVITSTSNVQGKTVMEMVKVKQRIYPIGRLDKDTSGLLLLTNDGDFADKLMHARYGHTKEYFVTLDRDLSSEHIKRMEKGMTLAGKKLQPVKVVMSKNKSARLELKEGVNRQIRAMLGRLGYTVKKLKRIRVGKLELGDIQEGNWKKIDPSDVL